MAIPVLNEESNSSLELRRAFYNLKLSQQQTKEFTSIMITSAHPKEGKTMTVLSFGLGLAREMPHRCLIVDANWMTPQLHHCFKAKREQSLIEFWGNPTANIQNTGIENLDVLPAPSGVEVDSKEEFVVSDIVKDVYEKITGKYKTVIFDTSSVLQNLSQYGSTPGLRNLDSLILSDFVQTSILVILARKSRRQDVKRVRFTLDRGRRTNIMAVLNNYKNPFYNR